MFNAKTSLIAAMVLLGGVILIQRDMVRTAKQEIVDETKRNLFENPDVTYEWFEISFPGERQKHSFRFRCAEKTCSKGTNQKWIAERPTDIELDPVLVGAALASLANIRPEEKIAIKALGQKDWRKEFGFEEPALKVLLKFTEESQPVEIRFGTTTPVGMNHYVLSSTSPDFVLTVPSYHFRALDRELTHWQEKHLVAGGDESKAEQVSWQHSLGGDELRAVRDQEIWWIEGKDRWRADAKVMKGLVSQLASWGTEKFAAAADFSRAKPYAKIVSVWAGAKRNELDFRLEGKDRVLVRSSDRRWVGEVKKMQLDTWLRTRAELRDPVLLTAPEKRELRRLKIRWLKSGESMEIAYQEPGAFTGLPDKSKWDERKVFAFGRLFVTPVVKAHIPARGALADRWAKSPDMSIEFLGDGDKVIAKIQLLTDFKDWVLVNGENSAELRQFDAPSAKTIPHSPKDLEASPPAAELPAPAKK